MDWTYYYDLDGRCTSMVSPAGTSTIGYADNGWVTSRVLPNGSTTDYTYNAVGMMTSLTNKKSNGSALTSFGTTSYDGAFNLTGMTATYSFPSSYGGASTWTYDDKDQLTNETSARNGGWNHTNEYDDAGNPTKFKNNTRTYNSNNQLTTGSMTYDGNGNPTTYAGATLTYDEQNRVTSIGSLLTCGYRADGQRAWKQGSTGGKTYFLYDQGNPIVEMNSSGTVTATNVYAPDGLVARKEGSNAWSYYSFDMQGNVTQKLSPSEAVTSGRVIDAWGTGQSTLTPYSPDCFGYNAKWGYYYDTQTGLYLCQHRMYDASTGRWLNRDQIGYAGGVNLYGYCGNGAVGGSDPSGLYKTGSYWGDVGQVFVGYGNFIKNAANAVIEDPSGLGRLEAFIKDPGCTLSRMWENAQFWNTDDPATFGERFAPYIPVIAVGVCSVAGSGGTAAGAAVRTAPASLEEQLALEETLSGQGEEIMAGKINDPKWQGFQKWEHNHPMPGEGQYPPNITIHAWRNPITGEIVSPKFKTPPAGTPPFLFP